MMTKRFLFSALVLALFGVGTLTIFSGTTPQLTGFALQKALAASAYIPPAEPVFGTFANYQSWPMGSYLKSGDTRARVLYFLSYFDQQNIQNNENSPQKASTVDINGDGLVDLLYHDSYWYSSKQYYYSALFLGNGNGFDLIYKCAKDGDTNKYYGDCASTSQSGYYLDPFDSGEYNSWTRSTTLKSSDKMLGALYQLAYFHDENPQYATSTSQKYSFTDINGDGLVDFLYHDIRDSSVTNKILNGVGTYAVYLNDGNANWTLNYKCYVTYGAGAATYYGDCAQ
jgi:hypothetical protein